MASESSRPPSFVVVIGDADRDRLDALLDRRQSIQSHILEAHSIDDAVAGVLAARPDLAVVPQDLEGQSHLEVCRRIKQLSPRVATLVMREDLDAIPPGDPAVDDYVALGDNEAMMARINVLLSLKAYNARALPIRERILEAFEAFGLSPLLLADGRLVAPSKVDYRALLDAEAIRDEEAALSKLGDTSFACYVYAPEPTCLCSSGRDGCLRGVCPVAQAVNEEPGFALAAEDCHEAAWHCARHAMVSCEPYETLCPGGYRLAAFPVALTFRAVHYPLLAVCVALPSAVDARQLTELARTIGVDPARLRKEVALRPLPQLSRMHLDALVRVEQSLSRALSIQVSQTYATAYNVLVEAVERWEHDRVLTRRSRQLQRANVRLREMNRLKSEFLANVSHELKTPMTSVIGFASLLLRGAGGKLPDKAEHFIDRVLANARSLHGAISDILDFAQLSTRATEPEISTFELPALVHECIEHVRPSLADKPVELCIDLPPALAPLRSDRGKLRQVLLNLLSNAVKFTNRGHIRVSAAVADGEPCPELAIAVADTGAGLAPDALPHIFEEFRQVDGSSTRRHGGAGLGLSLVKHLCRLLQGQVAVESRLDHGSTFTISIPTDLVGCQRVRDELWAQVRADEPDPSDRSTAIVLAVADAPQTVLDMRRWLEPHGYRVASAAHPGQGLEHAGHLQPCAFVVEVLVPGSDVWELADELRANPQTTDIPLLVVSALGGREAAEAAGAADWLAKPLDPDSIVNALDRLRSPEAGALLAIVRDAAARDHLRRTLRGAGYQLTACESYSDACHYADSQFDLIVLDPAAEGEGELTALGSIRSGPWASVPVVAYVAPTLPADEREHLAPSVHAIVEQADPTPTHLLEAVASTLSNARHQPATDPQPRKD